MPLFEQPREPSEKEFQAQVIDLARILGWTVAHFRPALTKHGWRTPAGADGVGFPDLVLVGHDQTLFRELKVGRGQLRSEQRTWQSVLLKNGADYAVWRPVDWPQIVVELGGKVAA